MSSLGYLGLGVLQESLGIVLVAGSSNLRTIAWKYHVEYQISLWRNRRSYLEGKEMRIKRVGAELTNGISKFV